MNPEFQKNYHLFLTFFITGELKNTYGTGCFLLQNTGQNLVFSKNGLLTTVAYQKSNGELTYAVEGSIAIAGLLIRWLRDNIGIINSIQEVETLAKEVDSTSGVFVVPAFTGLFCPYWKAEARGVISGLTQHCKKHHIARACLEAVAWQVKDVVSSMEQDGQVCTLLKADGGMTGNKLLMQIQSDILQIPILVPKMAESTALGAAVAAGSFRSLWKAPGWEAFDCSEADKNEVDDRAFSRIEPLEDRSNDYVKWKKAVEKSFE